MSGTDPVTGAHEHDHDHDHEHDHAHGQDGPPGAQVAGTHTGIDHRAVNPTAYRIMAIRDLLVEQGVLTAEDIDDALAAVDRLSPVLGARLVARAWCDEAFRERLLTDARSAAAELGIRIPEDPAVTVLENTADAHHVIVCTLCSCYPRALLGRPPDWYRSLEYRSRVVVEPRTVLREFGVEIADDVAVRVVDSTADHRYLVLPLRPPGTEDMTEEQLVAIITRDAMIGTGVLTG